MEKKVCVIGLGCIGLPIACVVAASGYSVYGVDINEKRIEQLRSLSTPQIEPGLESLLSEVLQRGNLKFSNKTVSADIYIIAVPTPLTADHQPNLSDVETAITSVIPYAQPKTLVLIESTCPIGTTDRLAECFHHSCPEVFVAYSPERVLPGNILDELIHQDRIVGGVNGPSTEAAIAFYRSFIKGEVLSTSTRMAEGVKLAENAYRDLNIAYANELSMLADALKLNVNEWISLANRHPRVSILQPGPGVGGHCIPIDPWFLIHAAPDLAKLITTAREVNQQKMRWVVDQIRQEMTKMNATVIACLGLTYKANVADLRESPALAIADALEKEGEVLRVDPYVPGTIALDEALSRAQLIVMLVNHTHFNTLSPDVLQGKRILNFAGVF